MKVTNSKAKHNYELGERWECGIVLTGAEAKSAKLGQVDMGGSYCKLNHPSTALRASKFQTELWVQNLKIFAYKHADNEKYDPMRKRKLLLHQREILAIAGKMKQMSRLLIPTAIYTKSDVVKIEVALARGKRMYEKREEIKKRDFNREMEREG